ncbi:hypothetical protein [Ancylobacter radicis]|uniref:Uncharacterized protein n=1 Tax=Ancylobacter radicis TaxID=2836179 RepID=A0ABS5RBI6_9HYPH|nr:hypothetical protein [Ancylobacter radicis]MBS9479038.1 hypothetical protein [Ancylobacter radicis]
MFSTVLTLVLVLAVTFSLPSFLALLKETQETVYPVLATVGTTALIGSLLLLAARLGWPSSAAVLVAAGVFDRFVYTPRSDFSHQLTTVSAIALLLIGISLGDGPVIHTH